MALKAGGGKQGNLVMGGLSINVGECSLSKGGQRIHLTPKMFTYICFARCLETTPGNACICTLFAESDFVSSFQMRNGFKCMFWPKSSAPG